MHGNMKPKERIELDSSMKCGNIFSVHVSGRRLDTCFYCYEIDGLMYLDPYAKAITDCGRFGQTDEKDVYLAAIDVADYDWEDDRPLNYDYSDCIFYKMNVRGFTKSRTSKVKDKGTFSGIINKIPYLKELGITTIELQPAYEFDEIGRFPQLTDTIMSKYGAGTHYSVDKNTRKINYWGYVGGFYFAPKASYSSIASKHPGVFRDYTVEFKNVVKELHRNGIEVVMEMFFTDESTGFILQCVRYWVTEYHIDGVHVYCDESALKALSQDALLADTKIITVYWNGKTGTKKHMANYNNDFQNIARRLLKGDENMLGEFAAISRKNETNSASINYIANNNGFTLNDLVSYDRKHNELNGENNRDGEDFNFSWNCGEEGSTRKRKIKELRMRQIQSGMAQSREMLGMKGGNRSAYWYTSKRLGRSMEIEEHKITPDSSLIGGRNDRFEEQKNIHKSSNDKTYNLSMDTGKNAILNADFKGRKSEKQIEKTDILSMEEHKTGSNALTMWNKTDTSRGFVPAGQSTQMIIGATGESDYEIMSVSEALYKRFDLKRVFYSAFINVNNDSTLPAGVGLMSSWSVLKPLLIPVGIITVVTIITVMGAAGKTSQWVIRRDRKCADRKIKENAHKL